MRKEGGETKRNTVPNQSHRGQMTTSRLRHPGALKSQKGEKAQKEVKRKQRPEQFTESAGRNQCPGCSETLHRVHQDK